MYRIIFLFIVIAFMPTRILFAQEGAIKGQLIDAKTKTPLAGANIQIMDTPFGAACDQNGRFFIPRVSVGAYALEFSYVGYQATVKTDVIVKPGRITNLEMELQPTLLETETISVSAAYFVETADQPVSTINFSGEEIRRAPGSAGDVSRIVMGLPSRNLAGEPNIRLTVNEFPKLLEVASSIDFVVTEYGVAYLTGRSVRERALALIDIAHPEDRAGLVERAKEARLIYRDQIYLDSGHCYPEELSSVHTFKDGLKVRFRAIRPSDEEEMRRLFYRFSSEAVYYRYFSPVKAMPHNRMQKYVNVDYRQNISIIGLVGESGAGSIIAEARYAAMPDRPYADTAFIVDEDYQGKGIATYLLNMLIRIAKERGLQGIVADVLATNTPMWKVYEKAPYPLKTTRKTDYYHLSITFDEDREVPISTPAGNRHS